MARLSIWYMWHTFINAIKRSWKLVIGIAVFLLIMFLGGFVLGRVLPKSENTKPQEKKEEIIDPEACALKYIDGYGFEVGDNGAFLFEHGEYHEVGKQIRNVVIGTVIMLFVAIGMMQGAKNGANIFLMSDVNFLFPSPNKPQSLLLFKMITQLGVSLLGAMYIAGQVPNLVMNAGLKKEGIVLVFITYILLQFVGKIVSVLTYVLLQNHPKLKKFFSRYALFFTILPVVVAAALHFLGGFTIYRASVAVFDSTVSRLFPIWGWLTAAGAYSFDGNAVSCLLFLLLTCVGVAGMIVITWRIPCDFYEDALTSATQISNIQEDAKEQANGAIRHNVERKGKKWEKIRNRAIAFEGFDGAKVLFAKTMLNRKRTYPLWGLWSNAASFYFWMALGFLGFMIYVAKIEEARLVFLTLVGLIIVSMFFRSFFNPLQEDLGHNFIYLMPEKPSSLLLWGMLGQMADGALDLLPTCILISFFSKSVVFGICIYFLLVSEHFFLGMTALMVNLVVSGYLPVYLSNFLQTIVRMLPFIPVLIIFLLGFSIEHPVLPVLLCVCINILASLLAFLPCPYHLHKGKR